MTTSELNAELALRERIHREMAETLDEELELELDDKRLDDGDATHEGPELDRRVYFRELLRLQGELVKLQDWVQHSKQRWWCCSKAATPPARAA